jgi:hypothetical protein
MKLAVTGAAMLLILVAAGAGAQQGGAKAEKKAARPNARIRALRGNPGFHYGSGYNIYSMHVRQPAKK